MVAVGLTACGRPAPAPSAIGGPFALTDEDGARVDQGILTGRWSLVFFGYTFCPDVCPATLSSLAAAIDRLGGKANAVQVVFITVDPDRDTPAQLKAYLASPSFPKRLIGLTGTAADIAAVAKAYHVYYQKAGAGAGYSVDHTSVVYLMDPHGRFVRPLAFGLSPAETARQIGDAMTGA
jgi:protein SCO1/2